MNWTQMEGQWRQLTGQVKSKWAKLTDDNLMNVAGKKDRLVGKLQERYGVLKEEAEKQADEWITKVLSARGERGPPVDVKPEREHT